MRAIANPGRVKEHALESVQDDESELSEEEVEVIEEAGDENSQSTTAANTYMNAQQSVEPTYRERSSPSRSVSIPSEPESIKSFTRSSHRRPAPTSSRSDRNSNRRASSRRAPPEYESEVEEESEEQEEDEVDEEQHQHAVDQRGEDRKRYDEDIQRSVRNFDDFRKTTQRESEAMEKTELLYRMQQLEKLGYPVSKRMTSSTPVDEIRYELYRQKRDQQRDSSLATMRNWLITLATFIERMNSRYNPLDLNLRGFARSVQLNIATYDENLLDLHHRYTGRSSAMHPAAAIGLNLGSSILFLHTSNVNEDEAKRPTGAGRLLNTLASAMPAGTTATAAPTAANPFQKLFGASAATAAPGMRGPPLSDED